VKRDDAWKGHEACVIISKKLEVGSLVVHTTIGGYPGSRFPVFGAHWSSMLEFEEDIFNCRESLSDYEACTIAWCDAK